VTLPNFLIIGAAKTGTTSLYGYLRQHPDVFMPEKKELHFFSFDENWQRGTAWYERHFAPVGDAIAVGEASASYTLFPHQPGVAARIADVLPDVRLIYVVRNPIDRIRSLFQHRVARGRELQSSIEQAVREDPFYVDTSRYEMQIDQYMEHFPGERLLVITSEDLRQHREDVVHRVHRFLGVDPAKVPTLSERELNVTRRAARPIDGWIRRVPGSRTIASRAPRSVKRRWSQLVSRKVSPFDVAISLDLRRELEDRLRDDVRGLRQYLGNGFDGWGIA
jgi:hypothetical protein